MKNIKIKSLLIAILFSTAGVWGQIPENEKPLQIGDEFETNIQTFHPYNISQRDTQIFEKEFSSLGSAYIKLYFENFDLAPNDYLEIISLNTGESHIYSGQGKIIDADGTMISNFWSKVIFDDAIKVRLFSRAPSNNHGFKIAKVAYGYSNQKIQEIVNRQNRSICGADDKEAISCYTGTDFFEKAEAVCQLIIGGTGSCTGWLLGCEGNVMTNNHCVGNSSDAANTDFVFNYYYENCNNTNLATTDVVASSSTLIRTSSSLDYSLLQLPVNPSDQYGYLSLKSAMPVVGDRIYIVGHPGGRAKEITVNTDTGGNVNGHAQVNIINTNGMRYYADTEPGSSGSPVIDFNTNLVVAIHNTGGCPNGSFGRSDSLISDIGQDMPDCGVDDSGQGCVSDLVITQTVPSNGNDIQEAENTITALNIIEASANAEYDAGVSVTLTPGFHARDNSTFRAYIEGCDPGFTENKSVDDYDSVSNYNKLDYEKSQGGNSSVLEIYPNPTKGIFTVRSDKKMISWELINNYGSLSKSNKVELSEAFSTEVDINNFPTGLYFLKITFENGDIIRKTVLKD